MSDLSDDDIEDVLEFGLSSADEEERGAMEHAMALEIQRRRGAAAKEIERLTPSDADRTALATAVRELTERRNNYQARLAHLTERTDPHVREVYERAVAEVDAAIEAVGRLAKR